MLTWNKIIFFLFLLYKIFTNKFDLISMASMTKLIWFTGRKRPKSLCERFRQEKTFASNLVLLYVSNDTWHCIMLMQNDVLFSYHLTVRIEIGQFCRSLTLVHTASSKTLSAYNWVFSRNTKLSERIVTDTEFIENWGAVGCSKNMSCKMSLKVACYFNICHPLRSHWTNNILGQRLQYFVWRTFCVGHIDQKQVYLCHDL